MRRRVAPALVAGLVAVSLLGTGAAAHAAPGAAAAGNDRRTITVDAHATDGRLQSLSGYVGGPCGLDTCTENPTSTWLTDKLHEIGVTATRTHDTGALDIFSKKANDPNVIFPDQSADPNNPKSYNFTVSDQIIKGMLKGGFTPLLRLGDGRDGEVPSDYAKFGRIVQRIVQHYNKGWAKGHHWNLKQWEIWNEPDLGKPGDTDSFWAGTPAQFYSLYAVMAKAVKSVDRHLLVGGPAAANQTGDYVDGFIQYVGAHKLPLDFFDYHNYDFTEDPSDFLTYTERIRGVLKANGLGKAAIVISEYGYNLFAQASQQQLAAFTSASLAYMQDGGVEQSYLEFLNIGDGSGNALINGAKFGPNGPGAVITLAGRAFEANTAMQATPVRLRATGSDDQGLTVLAGAATHNSTDTTHEIRVLVTNYEVPSDSPHAKTYSDNGGINLKVKNLPAWAKRGAIVSRYSLSESGMTLAERFVSKGAKVQLSNELAAPGVELVVIRDKHAPKFTYPGVVHHPAGH